METQPFLRDVDDAALFADMLENVYLLLYEELGDVLAQFPLMKVKHPLWPHLELSSDVANTYENLARMRHTMSQHIRDMCERKKRLRDRAIGLSEIELDE